MEIDKVFEELSTLLKEKAPKGWVYTPIKGSGIIGIEGNGLMGHFNHIVLSAILDFGKKYKAFVEIAGGNVVLVKKGW